MNTKFKINWGIIIFYIIGVIIISNICGQVISRELLLKVFHIDLNKINIENLMFYTWQVQVTIALITISLTSLIIGNLDRKITGQSVKDILMIRRKIRCIKIKKLSYVEKIIFIIALAVLNLWTIMQYKVSVLIIVFLLSMWGVLDLIIDSYNVIFNIESYRKIVDKYILDQLGIFAKQKENLLNILIDDIKEHNKELDNVNELKLNIITLINIANNLIKINKNNQNHSLNRVKKEIVLIEEAIEVAVGFMIINSYFDNFKEVISLILNSSLDKTFVNKLMWKLIEKLGDKVSENNCNEIINYILKENIIDINEKRYNPSVGIKLQCFKNIYNNFNLTTSERKSLINRFMKLLITNEFIRVSDDKKNIYQENKELIYIIIKFLVMNDDKELFVDLFTYIYNQNSFSFNLNKFNEVYEIIVTTNIFLYYINVRENNCNEDYKLKVQRFIKYKNKSIVAYGINMKELIEKIGINIWQCYEMIKQEMPYTNWEYTPYGAAKFLVIENVIDEYFLFYSIINLKYYEYQKYIEKNFNIDNCFMILSFYKNYTLRDEVKNYLKGYINLYDIKVEEDILNKKSRGILDITNNLYKKLEIQKQKSYIEEPTINKNINNIKNEIIQYIDKINLGYEILNKESENLQVDFISYNCEIDRVILAEESILLGTSYEEMISDDILQSVIRKISNKGKSINIDYSDSNKIECLFNFIEKENLDIKTILLNSNISDNIFLINNEKSEDIRLLKKFEVEKNKLLISDKEGDRTLFIKNENFEIHIEIKEINIKKCDESFIERKIIDFKNANEKYVFNVVNDISITLDEEEIKEYFRARYMCFNIELKIMHNIKENEVISVIYQDEK